jgi:hypothetical protein
MLTKLGCRSLDGGIARALPRMGFRRGAIAIITTLTVIVVQRGMHEPIPNAAASVVRIAAGPRIRSRTAFRIGMPKHTCQRPNGWRHAGAHKTARTPRAELENKQRAFAQT